MKNIFKSLMLVAVAAMAFTACQKDNDETNKAEQKTVITGVATITNDDTRSTFLPKEEGEAAYQSAWEGDETIKIFYNDKVATATIDANGVFTAELEGEVSSITVCSPASAWNDEGEYYVTDLQTSGANSVAPSVHILKSEATAIVDGAASVNMAHAVAYGKMTIGVPQDFATYRVAVTINNEVTYSITGGKNGTYWFATKPFAEVDTFKVAAYDVNGQCVEKTVSMEDVAKPLAFHAGRVSTFSVSGLTKYEEPADYNLTFTEAEYIGVVSDYQGERYVFKFSNSDNHEMYLGFHQNNVVDGALPVGTFNVGPMVEGNVYEGVSYFNEATFGTDWPTYMYNGKVVISKSGDTYSVVANFTDVWVGGSPKSIKATFEGTLTENNSGVDTTGYTLLNTGSHSFTGSTLWVTDTYYELNLGLYNGGAGSTVIPGEYTLNGIQSIEGTISGSPLLDGSKATIHDNGDGTYTILFDVKFGNAIITRSGKYYYTFSN